MTTLKGLRGLQVMVGEKCVGRVVQGALCDSLPGAGRIVAGPGRTGHAVSLRGTHPRHRRALRGADDAGQRLKMKPRSMLLRAISTDGVRLGAIADAAFDETSLAVKHDFFTEAGRTPFWGAFP